MIPRRIPKTSYLLRKPLALDLPEDQEERFIKVLQLLGPCSTKELKALIPNRPLSFPILWRKLVAEGKVTVLQEPRPRYGPRVFGLPGDEIWWKPTY